MAKKKTAKKTAKPAKKASCCTSMKDRCSCSGLYGIGFVGALVYYIATATGFWMGVWGVIKAIFWPAFLVYSLMKYLGM